MKKFIVIAIFAVFAGIGHASAQTYPARPITMIAPFPAGGPSDALARILSEPMRAALASEASGQRGNSIVPLGQPVIIENVAGRRRQSRRRPARARRARRLHHRHRPMVDPRGQCRHPTRRPTTCCTISSRSHCSRSRRN